MSASHHLTHENDEIFGFISDGDVNVLDEILTLDNDIDHELDEKKDKPSEFQFIKSLVGTLQVCVALEQNKR